MAQMGICAPFQMIIIIIKRFGPVLMKLCSNDLELYQVRNAIVKY